MNDDTRPNILYILTDQQNAEMMSCTGNPYLHTPAMDSLFAGGVRFEKAYTVYPLCSPARASMFSGKMPQELGYQGNFHDMKEEDRLQGLGHLLTEAGYECAYGGKWHVDHGYIDLHYDHGFEKICGFDDNELPKKCAQYLSRDHGKPFFLVAGFDNPHNICEWGRHQQPPWCSLPEAPRVEECPSLPANYLISAYEPWPITAHRHDYMYNYGHIPPNMDVNYIRRQRWAYARLTEEVDKRIGVILDSLRKNGLENDTIVIFSSDHGEQAGSHGLTHKMVMYDESTRIPFIFSGKRIAHNGEVNRTHLVSNCLDFYATICDYAHVQMPDRHKGKSLKPYLEGTDSAAIREFVPAEADMGEMRKKSRMIRTGRYKYVAYKRGIWPEQLFDMEKDPGEMVNLAYDSRYTDILLHHRELLRKWLIEENDPFGGGHYAHPDVKPMVPGDSYYK